jgi:benzoate-CoA ligase
MFVRDADDWYEYQGRSDDMLKISGQWVSPAEIEDVALTVPSISQVAVVGVTDRDGLVRLAMFMVADDTDDGPRATDTEALEERVRETLTGELSVYKCPRRIYFVDEMPLTGSGKLQRYQLRRLAEEREATRVA